MLIVRFLVCFCVLCCLPSSGWSSNALLAGIGNVYLVEKNKDWSIYTAVQEGQRFCYLLSFPTKHGDGETRGDAAIMVTRVSDVFDEVSVTFGVKYGNKPVVLTVDQKKSYSVSIIDDQVAWAENADIDSALIDAFKRGLSMSAVGYAEDGRKVESVYSLRGFSKSYERMRKVCSGGD
ncbi:invasion associated locus B family protein [Anaplasma capra]|uniref:invasion associated locus B family protein n=1 Tax=Anaplasma capra TaxID=1562740 RepID=UPI0021D61081|nr:invasion associated locus B family protein [Anaplasma capra]MCU7611634.1 invasion associated locus B family protein [Anaplasma capra]MCU7612218.1 invasion associated locus B family protein [Anaplasma capra]